MKDSLRLCLIASLLCLALISTTSHAQIASGLQGASGSAVGPDGALYVTEAAVGFITRIDPQSGATSLYAEGLPTPLPWVGFGGALDVAFLDGVAYALVTLVDPSLGGSEVTGVYRMDNASSFTPIANIGAHALANPPATSFDIPTGVQYAIETYRGGFLVTDGHLNRVLRIRLNGDISVFQAFGNIVPTGLDVHGKDVFMAQAGEAPHLPQDGKVLAFSHKAGPQELATGAMLAVDVEAGRGHSLFVLSQGIWDGAFPGSPALPGTGALFEVNTNGTLRLVDGGLNLPSSVELIGNHAYIVSLAGEVWLIENISQPPFGN